ncbi:MAG TPA: SIR2 family protein [Candidatus Methanomethylophilaceae archaeon]|nr:SIR2 family protein [Candidatus Methanomethylophilaceae archaeon]
MLIGSGISKRYVEDYPDFNELLRSIAERMGINKHVFVAYLADAKSNPDKQEMPQVASKLSKELISKIISGSINPETFFTTEELKQYHATSDPFKVLVASKLNNIKVKESPQLKKELELFKSLCDIVPCVITTNYDLFLEKEIFKGYKQYSRVSDYYFSDAQEIGDIYKIHGNVTYPSAMVITSEDYDNFEKNSKIVSAKILSLLCDYPMIIMGYSMEDKNVKGILDDLIHCLEKERLYEIEKNIIFISYDENESEMVQTSMTFPYGDKRVVIKGIKTNNFEKIFAEISKIKPTVPIATVRKLRRLVKDIVLTTNPIGSKVEMLGFDEIDDIPSDRLVLALASKEMIQKWKSGVRMGLYTYTVDEMIKDIFSGKPRFDPKCIFEWFDNRPSNISSTQFVPIFHFMRELEQSHDDLSEWTKDFIKTKKEQFEKNISSTEKTKLEICSLDIKSEDDLRNHLEDKDKRFSRPDIILYHYSKNRIKEQEAMNLLREFSGPKDKTSYRRAVTYLTFKNFNLK